MEPSQVGDQLSTLAPLVQILLGGGGFVALVGGSFRLFADIKKFKLDRDQGRDARTDSNIWKWVEELKSERSELRTQLAQALQTVDELNKRVNELEEQDITNKTRINALESELERQKGK